MDTDSDVSGIWPQGPLNQWNRQSRLVQLYNVTRFIYSGPGSRTQLDQQINATEQLMGTYPKIDANYSVGDIVSHTGIDSSVPPSKHIIVDIEVDDDDEYFIMKYATSIGVDGNNPVIKWDTADAEWLFPIVITIEQQLQRLRQQRPLRPGPGQGPRRDVRF